MPGRNRIFAALCLWAFGVGTASGFASLSPLGRPVVVPGGRAAAHPLGASPQSRSAMYWLEFS
jgi:hypothetical protein